MTPLKNTFLLIFLFQFLLSCEPDDICLSSVKDTPRLILGFYDINTGEIKEINNLKIQGLSNEEIYVYQTLDSIGIPLKNSENLTVYTLTKDFNENTPSSGNEDKVYFNYNYNWNYISRACGFITTYDIQDIIIENDSENWILNTEIIDANIIDEKKYTC